MKHLAVVDHPRAFSQEHINDVANAPLAASLNCGYACAVALRAGWETDYHDFLSSPAPTLTMSETILAHEPQIILIHWVYAWDNGETVTALIDAMRHSGYTGTIAAFGLFPTFCHDLLLQLAPGLDLILVGEFEETLRHLLEDSTRRGPGLSSRSGFPGFAPLITDLNALPAPIDLGRTRGLKHLNIAGSRGCYGRCSFCFIHPYYNDSCWRGREPDSILAEIALRRESRQVSHLYFVDPNFFGPGSRGRERAAALAERLNKTGLRFGLEARVNDIHEETTSLLRYAGLESVFLGIESASQPVLNRMKKGITPEESSRAIAILRGEGIFVAAGFIMFDPDSDLKDLRTNIDFLQENHLLTHHDQTANMLYHRQIILRGSPAWAALARQNRLLVSARSDFEALPVFLDPRVREVSEAMGLLTTEYFLEILRLWSANAEDPRTQFESCHEENPVSLPDDQINELLTEGFEEFLSLAEEGRTKTIRDRLNGRLERLRSLFSKETM